MDGMQGLAQSTSGSQLGARLRSHQSAAPSRPLAAPSRPVRVRTSSEPNGTGSEEPGQVNKQLKDKFFQQSAQDDANLLDSVNPYALGRQARRAFDEVWTQLSNIASPTKSFIIDDVMEPMADDEFQAPQAPYTTVLVVGATGRVGRIVTRKLLLRGYTVKALVRKREGKRRDEIEVPEAVQVVEGDVGDMDACQEAVRGVSKVSTAQPLLPAWLSSLPGPFCSTREGPAVPGYTRCMPRVLICW